LDQFERRLAARNRRVPVALADFHITRPKRG
jgi:hypothetical protein